MIASLGPVEPLSSSAVIGNLDLTSSPEAAFALLCEVEKWPVWLSFMRSARRVEEREPLGIGSEIVLRGSIPGDTEELYEVDHYLPGHILSLVGAYSVRRRIDFRVERKSTRSKLAIRMDYPAYGGALGALFDRMTARRRLIGALEDSLLHFKGLVEFKDVEKDALIADF